MILIYQMTKVASRSWVEAAKPAAEIHGTPLHCHFIVPGNRDRIRAAFDRPADRQTIANMLLSRNMLRVGAAILDELAQARDRGERVRVISGMRDPVARSISLVMFLADFYGQTAGPLMLRQTPEPADVIAVLQDSWSRVLEDREPEQTFDWLLWFLTRTFRTWFDDELGAAFDVNVLGRAFESEAVPSIRTGCADILLYRVEDMLPAARFHPRLVAQARAFLGIPLDGFPAVNTSATRRSKPLSAAVRRQFRLPSAMLDAIYDAPIVRHFYSRDEIAAFRQRWSAPPAPDHGESFSSMMSVG